MDNNTPQAVLERSESSSSSRNGHTQTFRDKECLLSSVWDGWTVTLQFGCAGLEVTEELSEGIDKRRKECRW